MALDLGKQVGPLPLGAWMAVIGGGLALGWYATRSGGAGTDAAPEDQLLAESGVGTGGGQFVYEPPTTITPDTTETLDQWADRAIRYLISLGTPPLDADRAIKKYTSNQTLTNSEGVLVNKAINGIGPPPPGELPAPSTVEPPPSPTPTVTRKITISAPSSFRRGTSVVVNGRVTEGSKGVGGIVVTVHRKRFGGAWRWYKIAPTLSDGKFTVRATSPDRHSFRLRFTAPGATPVERSFTVR